MDSLLTSININNEEHEEFYLRDLAKSFLKFKGRDKIFKIALWIFILIILSFLIILTCKAFNSKIIIEQPGQKETEEKETEEKEAEEKETGLKQIYLNLPSDPEFKKFYENFPFSILINDNEIISIDKSSLENTSPSELIYLKEDYYEFNKIEISQGSKSSNSENIDFSFSGKLDIIFHSNAKFKSKIEEVKNEVQKTSYIIVKKKISSLSVKRDNIEANKSFKKKIEEIAYEELYSDEEKASKLDKLFNEYGYFIPLKITIGGYFYQEINKIENENLINEMIGLDGNMNLKISKNIQLNSSLEYNSLYENFFNNLFSSENIKIFGGDTSKKTFNEWEASLNYENAQIIEYNNIVGINSLIEDFLDRDIKIKLKNPLNIINTKYEKRKEYYERLKEAKEFILNEEIKNEDHSKRNGLCYNDDLIYSETFPIKKTDTIKIIDESFQDIIVGWKIISKRNDGYNGKFTFKDPILTKKIYIEFVPKTTLKISRDQEYDLEIFLIRLPE